MSKLDVKMVRVKMVWRSSTRYQVINVYIHEDKN